MGVDPFLNDLWITFMPVYLPDVLVTLVNKDPENIC